MALFPIGLSTCVNPVPGNTLPICEQSAHPFFQIQYFSSPAKPQNNRMISSACFLRFFCACSHLCNYFINKKLFPDNVSILLTYKWIGISFILVTWIITGDTCICFKTQICTWAAFNSSFHANVVVSNQPLLLQGLAKLSEHYARFSVSLPNESLSLTGHQNTSNFFISCKRLPSMKHLPFRYPSPGQRTVAENSLRKSERWSQICCTTKYILNNNWIHAEMKAVNLNTKYFSDSFSSFFQSSLFFVLKGLKHVGK